MSSSHRLGSACCAIFAACSLSAAPREPEVTAAGMPAVGGGELSVHYSEERAACAQRYPKREAWFGDLHVHTSLSLDAYREGVRTSPEDAYAFARGAEIPFHDRTVRIDQPLDFAAVTDHSEFLGPLTRCLTPSDAEYDTPRCEKWRVGGGSAARVLETAFAAETEGSPVERATRALNTLLKSEDLRLDTELCGTDGQRCAAAMSSAWAKIQEAAEDAYDRSANCAFTSFVGYEYSGIRTGSNYHRNVLFRNARVPFQPISAIDAPQDRQLWEGLERSCIDAVPGCDYLAIPHNANLSNGKLLGPDTSPAGSIQDEQGLAQLRRRAEPVMEIFQHKGQSECINGISGIDAAPDPLCDFEQVRTVGGVTVVLDIELPTLDCGNGVGDGGMIDVGCISRNDYLRGALLTGLRDERRLGVNPLQLGVIASTDTHESTPGAVDEETWQGHVGRERAIENRLGDETGLPLRIRSNPGGLAGVWAVENSRDAIFDALRRREVFGTSGPRIRPRFFGGWTYAADVCDSGDLAERGYRGGVPMGGELSTPPASDAAPRFVAFAVRDPDGNLLQRLQIVKGWIDADGSARVLVTDVAGDANSGADVDLETGAPRGPGSTALCAVYEDRDFDPAEPAWYYLRVVENPSLRWSWAACIALPEAKRPPQCVNDMPKTIQERAWSSPIWYVPPNA